MRVIKKFTKPSMTKQSFKKDCDVNEIVKKFKRVVGVDYLTRFQGTSGGTFGDFSGVTDYQSALARVDRANEAFMSLPAKIRAQFKNDAGEFLAFVQDTKNAEALVKMGLAVKTQREVPIPDSSAG